MKPYEIWFGKFKGKTVEQLIWQPGFHWNGVGFVSGWDYLVYAVNNFKGKEFKEFVKRAEMTLEAGRSKKCVVPCQCGKNPAQSVWVAGNESWITIGPIDPHLYCAKC